MKLAATLFSATALALVATASYAADVVQPEAPIVAPPSVWNWTGFHVGVGGGAAYMHAGSNSYSNLNWDNEGSYYAYGGEKSDLGKFGVFGTIEGGYDVQMNQFVLGGLVDFNLQSLTARTRSYAYVNTNNNGNINYAAHTAAYKVGNSWDAGVRLGYLVNPRNLFYVTGGYSSADIRSGAELDVYFNNSPYPDYVNSYKSSWKSGYFIGFGLESLLTQHLSLKAEYRFSDYGKVKTNYSFDNGNGFYGNAGSSASVNVHTVRLVLSYRF